jgi:acyl phosphate:glycerol-3-phosphate acyltransferase
MAVAVNSVLALALGYVLGSIPFGLVLTRAAGLGDVRNIGSGNIGATNVLRTGNKGLAAATLLLDGLKGTVAVLIAQRLLGGSIAADVGVLAGLGAFLGHLFPVWLGFKGGKGVATFIGVVFALAWPLGLLCCLVWLIVAALTRLSSLAALSAIAATVVAAFAGGVGVGADRTTLVQPVFVASVLALMAILLYWKHRENIARLIAGTESRIGAKG